MTDVWLKLRLDDVVVEDIASIQHPLTRLSWIRVTVNCENLRDIRTSEPGEARPGTRIG